MLQKRNNWLKLLGLCGGGLLLWVHALWLGQSIAQPFKKDLRHDYVMAKALANGQNPHLLERQQANGWLGQEVFKDESHANPHTFVMAWLWLPLTLLSYPQAALVWLFFEMGCLLIALEIWRRLIGQPSHWQYWALSLCCLLAWHPLVLELWFGQVSVCLLALFLGAWLALRAGRDGRAGCLLGLAVVLKLMGGPLLLWLLFKRRWQVIGAAASVWTTTHLLAIGIHGWETVRDYYLKIGPEVGVLYRLHDANLSVWTIGQRLFGAMHWYFVSVPLWDSPRLAKLVGALATVSLLGALLYFAERAQERDTAYALLFSGGLFLTPITWQHYFVMALPALALLFQRLRAQTWPRWQTASACLFLLLLSLPHPVYVVLVEQFARGTTSAGLPIVPALPALLTLLPTVALGAALWQMVRLERAASQPANAVVSGTPALEQISLAPEIP